MNNKTTNRIRWRVIILGLLLTIPYGYFSIQTPTPSTVSLVYPVVMILTLLVLLNIALKKWINTLSFSQGELLTLYDAINRYRDRWA
jgi:uncharacterized membrane protein